MSASSYRSQLDRKRKQRIEAEKKLRAQQSKEASKRASAAKATAAARQANSDTTRRAKQRDADRDERAAAAAGKEATNWAAKVSRYSSEEASLMQKLTKAEKTEADAAERSRAQDQQRHDRRDAAHRATTDERLRRTEQRVTAVERQLPPPRAENLRILLLGAGPDGGLRIGREQKRIRAAVRSASLRDLIDIDAHPAATTADLQDGLSGFQPHVVHFSGHSSDDLIVFEADVDEPHHGAVVTAAAFRAAVNATDRPPMLVVLNSCRSASQIDDLVATTVPFAIGMAAEIDDLDAISYAARFYTDIANGQSLHSAHRAARAALELQGLDSGELPTLAAADGYDPAEAIFVSPPSLDLPGSGSPADH